MCHVQSKYGVLAVRVLQSVREQHFYAWIFLMRFNLRWEKAGGTVWAEVRPLPSPSGASCIVQEEGFLLPSAKDTASRISVVVKNS